MIDRQPPRSEGSLGLPNNSIIVQVDADTRVVAYNETLGKTGRDLFPAGDSRHAIITIRKHLLIIKLIRHLLSFWVTFVEE